MDGWPDSASRCSARYQIRSDVPARLGRLRRLHDQQAAHRGHSLPGEIALGRSELRSAEPQTAPGSSQPESRPYAREESGGRTGKGMYRSPRPRGQVPRRPLLQNPTTSRTG